MSNFSTKQKVMFVVSSALLIGAVTGACIFVVNEGIIFNFVWFLLYFQKSYFLRI